MTIVKEIVHTILYLFQGFVTLSDESFVFKLGDRVFVNQVVQLS